MARIATLCGRSVLVGLHAGCGSSLALHGHSGFMLEETPVLHWFVIPHTTFIMTSGALNSIGAIPKLYRGMLKKHIPTETITMKSASYRTRRKGLPELL